MTVTISIVTITASVSPTSDLPGALFTFTAVATGGAGAPYTFLWRFGDGATSTGATATHSYSTPGNYTASVTATDSLGGSGTTELASAVTVRTPDTTPPTITHATPGSVVVGDDIHIAATVADADSPVQEVHLVYTSVGGTEQNVTMTLLDGEYVYVIPGQTSAGTVRYRIYAADASGNARLTQEYMVTVTGHSTAGALDTGLIGILVAILAASIATTAFALRRRRKGRGKNPPPSRPPPSRTEEGSPQAPPESESGSVDQSGALGGWSRRFHLAYRREGRSEPPRSRGGRTRRVARDAHRLRVNRELVGARLGILRRTSRGERMHGPGVIPILECVATPRHLALSRLTVRDALSLGLRTGRQLPSEICCEAFPARVNARIDCLVSGSTLNSSDPLKARIGKVTPLRTLVWKRVTDHGGSGS